MKLQLLLSVFTLAPLALADIVLENEEIIPSEIFDLKQALDSDITWTTLNATKYYCIFRGTWNSEDHPADYPRNARWGNQVIYSHTKQYAPFIKSRQAPLGVEHIAESGFTDIFEDQLTGAGELVNEYGEGGAFNVDQDNWDQNYQYLPPIKVSLTYPFLSGISGIMPSPDWFTAFYMMDTIDRVDNTFWDRFRIQTYPWDAGTDDGRSYTSSDRDVDRDGVFRSTTITRITTSNTQDDIFVSPNYNGIEPIAEWECLLHVCPLEFPDCQREDFPPANGCDILKYPACIDECDPNVDAVCQECEPIDGVDPPSSVYYSDCCLSGRDPKGGNCANSGVADVMSVASVSLAVSAGVVGLFLM